MFEIKVHNRMYQVTSVFYFLGLWNYNDESNVRKWGRKMLYLIVLAYYPISFGIGACTTEYESETRFFAVGAVVIGVLTVRLYNILWKKDEICELMFKIGEYSTQSREEFNQINNKIKAFMIFSSGFVIMSFLANIALIIIRLPFFTNEKHLPVNLYLPFDWRKSEVGFWMSYAFVSCEMLFSALCTFHNIIIWYLMISYATKYQILCNEFKGMWIDDSDKKENLFLEELIVLMKRHQDLKEATHKFKSYFGSLFFIQIATSGLGICGSIYVLAFTRRHLTLYMTLSQNLDEHVFEYGVYVVVLVYNVFDIFMVMYFGNEIRLLSSRLSYCLFESNWMMQSQSYKKSLIICMELLKQPQSLLIGKLYPLNLETFTSIINFAYRLFNILKSFK